MKRILPLLLLSGAATAFAQERLIEIQLDTFETEYTPVQKDLLSYENGLNTEITSQLYIDGAFSDAQNQVLTYNGEGQVTLNETFVFQGGSEVLISTQERSYSEGLLSEQITAQSATVGGVLVNTSRDQYEYNANEDVTSVVFSNWNDSIGDWEFNQRQIYTYDGDGNNTEVLIETYEPTTQAWELLGNIFSDYENGLLVKDSLVIASPIGVLVFNANEYAYDAEEREIEQITKALDFVTFSTQITGRVATSYDGMDEDPSVEITANYTNMMYVDTTKVEYTYNENDNISVQENFFSEDEGASYNESERTTYTYQSTVGVEEVVGTVSVYPNPATDRLWIETAGEELATISVMSMNGQVILSEVNPMDNVVEVNDLANGVYLIKVGFSNGSTKTATFQK